MNKQFLTKAAKIEVLSIPDDGIVLANILCLLDFDCEILNSITDTVKEYTTEGIPTVLTTFLLSGLCQPYKDDTVDFFLNVELVPLLTYVEELIHVHILVSTFNIVTLTYVVIEINK